jgi:hypothetical protein
MDPALLSGMSRYDHGLLACLCVIASTISACYPKYSPPVRAGTYGIPDMQRAGSAAVQIGGGVAPMVGDPLLAYVEPRLTLSLNEIFAVDANFYTTLLDADTEQYRDPTFMGSMGVLVRWIQRPESGWRASLVLGPAMGRGGELRFPDDYPGPRPKNPVADRVAFGGFVAGNLAYRFSGVEVFLGNRLDLVEAAPNPRTFWHSHMLGIQAELSRRFFMSVELAMPLYESEYESGGLLAATLSLGGRSDE